MHSLVVGAYWNITYSGTSVQGTPSELRKVSGMSQKLTNKGFIYVLEPAAVINAVTHVTFLWEIVALLFLQVQYINFNLREIIIVHVVKAAIIVIMVHFNLSTLFVVSHILSTKVSPEWR